jgi:hypothetical protein
MVALAHADRLPAIPAGHRRRGPDQDLQFRRQLAAREHEGGEADVALQYHRVCDAVRGIRPASSSRTLIANSF